jgi:hypothetical protein
MPQPETPTARVKIRASLIETFVETGCRDADAQRYADETIAEISAMALAEAADSIVAACFTHNPDAATGWITCHCEVADDLRKQAALS